MNYDENPALSDQNRELVTFIPKLVSIEPRIRVVHNQKSGSHTLDEAFAKKLKLNLEPI